MSRDLVVPPPFSDPTDEHNFDENTDNNDEVDDPPAIFCGSTYLLGKTYVFPYHSFPMLTNIWAATTVALPRTY